MTNGKLQVTTDQFVQIRCAAIQAAALYTDGRVMGVGALLQVADTIERHMMKDKA